MGMKPNFKVSKRFQIPRQIYIYVYAVSHDEQVISIQLQICNPPLQYNRILNLVFYTISDKIINYIKSNKYIIILL